MPKFTKSTPIRAPPILTNLDLENEKLENFMKHLIENQKHVSRPCQFFGGYSGMCVSMD
jgi:hypothetical protein